MPPVGLFGFVTNDELRAGRDRSRQRHEVVGAALERRAHGDGAHLGGVDRVDGERRPAERDLVPGLEQREREVVEDRVRAVADHHLVEVEAVTLGERGAQVVAAAVGIAVALAGSALDRLERGGERPVLSLVGGELDHRAGQPELALHELDRPAGLVGDQARRWPRGTARTGRSGPCGPRYQR